MLTNRTRRAFSLTFGALLLLLIAAPAPALIKPGPVPALFVKQQQSDTTVKAATTPLNRGAGRLVSEMQIGGASATADEYIFSSITEMLPLRDGSLVIIDRGPPLIARLYNTEGKFVRSLGRQGDGPGEYRNPAGIAQHQDGRVLIRDADGRISVFGNSGPGAQFFAPASSGTATGGDFLTVAPNGTIQMRTPVFLPSTRALGLAPDMIRIRPDGSLIDTIRGPVINNGGATRLTSSADGVTRTFTVPYTPTTEVVFSPLGYFIVVHTGKYQIDMRVPRPSSASTGIFPATWREGDPVVSIRRTIAPVTIAEDERAEQRKRIEDQMRRTQSNWQWTGPDIPRVKPAIRTLLFGPDGSIWVQLSQPSERFVLGRDAASAPGAVSMGAGGGGGAGSRGDRPAVTPPPAPVATWREPPLYDVFAPDGTYVGQVGVPFGTTIIARRGDRAWGLTRDSDGVLTVHRFRIVWG